MSQMLRSLGYRIDQFFSGHLVWLAKRWLADYQLGKVLNMHGDQSFEARRAVAQCSKSDFAIQYFRSGPPWMQRAVRGAVILGHHRQDLRLAVLNCDIVDRDGTLAVRQKWWLTAMAYAAQVLVFIHFTLICALTVIQRGDSWKKIVTIVGLTIIYSVLWRGWSLFTIRPLAAGAALAKALVATPVTVESAKVILLS